MRCIKCGFLNNSTNSYCASCGEKLVQENSGEQQFYNNENLQGPSGARNGGNQYSANYNSSQQDNHGSGRAAASLICGIFSLIFGILPLAVVAIVLGVYSKNDLRVSGEPTGKATAGMVLGIISVILSVIITILIYVYVFAVYIY